MIINCIKSDRRSIFERKNLLLLRGPINLGSITNVEVGKNSAFILADVAECL